MKLSLRLSPPAGNRGWRSIYPVCGFQTCSSTLLMRSLPGRAGVKVGQQWYCSVDCFALASRSQLSALSGGNVLDMRRTPRLSIGLVLLSKGHLTDGQLRSAMAESQRHGESLEATLVRLGLATERTIVAARAAQWGCPVLAQDREAQHVESDIPPTLLQCCSAVPLHYSFTARRILLGFVYRVEHSLLNALDLVSDLRAEPCFIAPSEFKEQTRRVMAAPNYEEVVFEETQTLTQMARNVGGFAAEIAVREARFARCRDYIWTRLTGRKGKIDLLFRVESATQAGKKAISPILQKNIRSVG